MLAVALGVLTFVRREAWFGNPPEPEYTIDTVTNRLLTFNTDSSLVYTYRDNLRTDQSQHIRSRGGQAEYHIIRAHLDTPRYRTILVLGDIQSPSDEEAHIAGQALRRAVRLHNPDLILQLGDLIERPTQQAWSRMAITFDSVDTVIPLIAVLGNHDYLKGLDPEPDIRTYWAFPYFADKSADRPAVAQICLVKDTLDLFIIDSNRSIIDLYRQSAWLNHALAESTARRKLLLTHHPLRSSKSALNNLFVRLAFDGLVRQYGIDLVLSGHEHTYLHTEEPYHQIITNFSGKNYQARGAKGRHYLIIRREANSLIIKAYDADDRETESFSIEEKK